MMRVESPFPGAAPRGFLPGEMPGEFYGWPNRIDVYVDDGTLQWDVHIVLLGDSERDALTVDRVEVQRRPGGPPAMAAITQRQIPMTKIVAAAIDQAAERWEVTGSDGDGKVTLEWVGPKSNHVSVDIVTDASRPRSRRNEVTPEMRAGALALYEKAKATGVKDPIGWVADQIGRGRSAAGQWIKTARDERKESGS